MYTQAINKTMSVVNIEYHKSKFFTKFYADQNLKPSSSGVPERAVDLHEKFRPRWVVL